MIHNTDLNNLKNDFKTGNAVIFVGAGVSIGASLPGWYELIKPLAEAVEYRLPSPQDITAQKLLDAAQRYENLNGRARLIRHFQDKLDTTLLDPSPAHKVLVALPSKIFFTTNYDNLLEEALKRDRIRRQVIIGESQLPLWRDDQTKVVKICGDLEQPESLVITSRDFNTLLDSHSEILARVRNELISKTALFVGYSLQDPFFNQLWDRLGEAFAPLQRTGYAVFFDADPNEIDDLKQRHIRVINLTGYSDKTQALTEFLQSLIDESNHINPERPERMAENDGLPLPRYHVPPPPPKGGFSHSLQVKLRDALSKNFKSDELEILCNDVGIEFDNIEGTNRTSKALNLVGYVDRRGELNKLLFATAKSRPMIKWVDILGEEAIPYLP